MLSNADRKSIAAVMAWSLGVTPEVDAMEWAPLEDQLYYIHRTGEILERQQRDVIRRLRRAGMTWAGVGEILGVTRQAAQQKYGALD